MFALTRDVLCVAAIFDDTNSRHFSLMSLCQQVLNHAPDRIAVSNNTLTIRHERYDGQTTNPVHNLQRFSSPRYEHYLNDRNHDICTRGIGHMDTTDHMRCGRGTLANLLGRDLGEEALEEEELSPEHPLTRLPRCMRR